MSVVFDCITLTVIILCTPVPVATYIELSQPNILRLAGGTTLYNGVVEWKRPSRNDWTPFAYEAWSSAHSEVACHALGFTSVSGAHYSVPRQSLAPSTCFSRLSCSGSEGTFAECSGLGENLHCTLDLAGIQCARPLEALILATSAPTVSPSTPNAIIGMF